MARASRAAAPRPERRSRACASRPRFLRQRAQSGARGDHRRSAGVDGIDDLAAIDALQVDRRDPQVSVTELALDDDQRDFFACHLHGVGMSQLMGRKPPAHT